MAASGYWITPDKTPMVNEQNLLISTLKPGSSVTVLQVTKNQHIPERFFLFRLISGQENNFLAFPLQKFSFRGDSILIKEYSKDSAGLEKAFHLADVCYPLAENSQITYTENVLSFTILDGRVIKESISKLRNQVIKNNIVKKTFLL